MGEDKIAISAALGLGMEQLLRKIETAVGQGRHHILLQLPYSQGGLVQTLHDGAQVMGVEYTQDSIQVEAVVDPILYGRVRLYITKEW